MRARMACLAMLVVGPATAQNSDWSFALSPYGWVPSISTRIETDWGSLAIDKSHGEVLGKLDVAFMGMFEARKGPWGLIADLFYADLAQNQDTPLALFFSRARVEIQARAVSGYAAYRVHEGDRIALDYGFMPWTSRWRCPPASCPGNASA